MKITSLVLLSGLAKQAISSDTPEGDDDNHDYHHVSESNENVHNTAFGIIRSILDHRDLSSVDFVKFNEWESPSSELYIVPTVDQNEEPAFGLGYRFINEDETVVNSPDISNVLEIREENVTAAGFPFQWLKHKSEEKTADDYFPFGSKKFMMIGVNKESTGNDYVSDYYNEDESINSVQLVTAHGLFNWFGGEEDDCNADEKTNTLFDTDHFLFVGVANADDSNNSNNLLFDKREENYMVKYITLTTTETQTVISTSVKDNYITTTVFPSLVPPLDDQDFYYDEDDDEVSSTSLVSTLTTQSPVVFKPIIEPSDTVDVSSTWTPTSESLIYSSTLSYATNEPSVPKFEGNVTTEWSVPETWNSYPFTSTDGLYFEIPAPYQNLSSADLMTSLTFSNSTIQSMTFTASYFGNSTAISKSTDADGSIYTRTKVGNLSVVTSENVGNNVQNGGYWASVSALVFAVLSGFILI